jgi:catechol 2,3-dioxygenase
MILRLAHLAIAADDLAAARAFYVDLLGFLVHDESDERLLLRGSEEFDTWSLAIVAGQRGGLLSSGFRVGAAQDLDALERRHERLGAATARVPATEGHGPTLRVATPDGHAISFVHDVTEIDPYGDGGLRLPMRDGAAAAGVPPARLDHVSLRVADLDASLAYWVGELDFSAAELWMDETDRPRIAWVRRTPRSHDVALGRDARPGFHHFAYAVSDSAALLRAADLMGDAGLHGSIEWGPSRHGATNALAMYVRDPAGNRLELYTGDYWRDLDRPPLRWSPDVYAQQGHSWWGAPPPERFAQAQPLLHEGWPG